MNIRHACWSGIRTAGNLLRRLDLPDCARRAAERCARAAAGLLQGSSRGALLFWLVAERLGRRPLLTLLCILPIVLHSILCSENSPLLSQIFQSEPVPPFNADSPTHSCLVHQGFFCC